MRYGRYRVTGGREYRGHAPGTTFEATLDPGAAMRAVRRGDIRLLAWVTPTVADCPHTFPEGWLPANPHPPHPRRRKAPLSLRRE